MGIGAGFIIFYFLANVLILQGLETENLLPKVAEREGEKERHLCFSSLGISICSQGKGRGGALVQPLSTVDACIFNRKL